MKKKFIKVLCIALVFAIGTTSVAAYSYLLNISAYLNYGITIKYDGETQYMYDANGEWVCPISYNGTTYLPVRAVADMLGVAVEWDSATNTILLKGTNTTAINTGGNRYTAKYEITAASFPLYLYAQDGTFLGNINSNEYDRNSIANEYGNYGSPYRSDSIFNEFGDYGSPYSQYSVFNEYAQKPPKIINSNGETVGYLTANSYLQGAISYEEMMVLLKKFNK